MTTATKTEREGTRVGQLCHDVRQYVRAAQLIAGHGPVAEDDDRLNRVVEVLDLLSDLLSHELERAEDDHGPSRTHAPVGLVPAVERIARAARAVVTIDVDPADLAATRSLPDLPLVTRAVANLVDNAGRAAGPEGRVHVSVVSEPHGVTVAVSDDGPGLGLIEPGTGQGLTTVGAAMAACHGTVEIVSDAAAGTTVRLRLPRNGPTVVS